MQMLKEDQQPRSFVAAVEFVQRIVHEHVHGVGNRCDGRCRSLAINIILGLQRRDDVAWVAPGPHDHSQCVPGAVCKAGKGDES